jgi:phosphoribosylanthranilate isomerase
VPFELLPALDVSEGRPVGPGERHTAAGPLEIALTWQREGAAWIHLVDLDAAFERGSNAELLASTIQQLDIDVELAGGVRDDSSLAWALSTGCRRVILSTTALVDLGWCARMIAAHRDRIAVGLDVRIVEHPDGVRQHRLEPRGGTSGLGDLWETLALLDEMGAARYVVTDVGRDGALSGPNLELYQAVALATSAPVVTSGGASTLTDLVELADLAVDRPNIEGAIVGTALHAERFSLPAALDAVRSVDSTRSSRRSDRRTPPD